MDLQSSPSIATLRTALDVPEGTLIGNHHRVLIQRTRGLIPAFGRSDSVLKAGAGVIHF